MARWTDYKPMVVGARYGRLTAISHAGSSPQKKILWRFICDCGNETAVAIAAVKRGETTSCGCYRHERALRAATKHGHAKRRGETAVYGVWKAMIDRCCNSNHKAFKHYGGRGISVSEPWRRFETFLEDMGSPPEGFTLERIDNNAPYEKENCRWASRGEQSYNKRNTVFVDLGGQRTPLAEVAMRHGVKPDTARWRLRHGWPAERAVGAVP